MQLTLALASGSRLLEVHRILLARLGPVPCPLLDPVSQLVLTMLSGRTRDEAAMAVFLELRANLQQRWEDLPGMPPALLLKLIAGVTFAERKAVFLPDAIQAILARRGNLDFEFLRLWPIDDAHYWLASLPGVGSKTSAAVLNFSTLNRRILMVDTAHNRVAKRLGFVPEKAGLARAARMLNRQLPDDWAASDARQHHIVMQRLGAQTCTHSNPRCADCCINAICPSSPRAGERASRKFLGPFSFAAVVSGGAAA